MAAAAAGGKSVEESVLCGVFAEVERLRVPLGRELDDRVGGQVVGVGAETVADVNVF